MKLLPNMKLCDKCNTQYPARFDKCPMCHEDAVSAAAPALTPEQLEEAGRLAGLTKRDE